MTKLDRTDGRLPIESAQSAGQSSLILETKHGPPQDGGQNHEFVVDEEISRSGQ